MAIERRLICSISRNAITMRYCNIIHHLIDVLIGRRRQPIPVSTVSILVVVSKSITSADCCSRYHGKEKSEDDHVRTRYDACGSSHLILPKQDEAIIAV